MRTTRRVAVAPLKAVIEAADRAAARGVPGEALRLLLAWPTGPVAPDHDHPCPQCGEAWSHVDEPCGDPAAAMPCGSCEGERDREPGSGLGPDPAPAHHLC